MDAPYSQEAEEAVIGAVFTSPLAYLNISSFLKSDDFFFLKHAWIWEAMRSVIANDDKIDTVTVSERLLATGQLVEVGGPAYFTQLISSVPTSAHAEVYGRLVERCAIRRRIMQAADKIILLAVDETISVEEVCMQSEAELLDVTGLGVEQKENDIATLAQAYQTNIEKLIELRQQGIMPGLPTGFGPVDDIIGGSYRGEITLIAAPLKHGKTTYSLNVARNRASAGARIVIFSIEMDSNEIIRKMISAETGISIATIKDAKFTVNQRSQMFEATRRISKWPLHIIASYRPLTPIDIRRELRQIVREQVIDNVLIDGLWLMASNNTRRSITDNRWLEYADIMIELIKIKREFNISIDLVHQCNAAPSRRGRTDKRFQESDLGGAIAIGQNVDTIIGLYRHSYYYPDTEDNDLEVIVKATRAGNTGTAILQFDKDHERYTYSVRSIDHDDTPQPNVIVRPPGKVPDDSKGRYH